MTRITNEMLDKKMDTIVEQMKIQNGRTFENSKDIAKMKGIGTAISFIVSVLAIIGVYLGIKK